MTLTDSLLGPPQYTTVEVTTRRPKRLGPTGKVRAKTAVEWCLTLVTTVVWVPILVGLAALVWVDSPGPVFHRQTRVGLRGCEFTIWKLRTMYADAPPIRVKMPNDPRVTPMGRSLRKWSLDELPQLWNVLRGDMALVGPRPHFRSEVDRYYTTARAWYRLHMRPGITGLWQVSGRSNLPPDKQIDLDVTYVARWSLWLDLRIIARTLLAVFRADGAY